MNKKKLIGNKKLPIFFTEKSINRPQYETNITSDPFLTLYTLTCLPYHPLILSPSRFVNLSPSHLFIIKRDLSVIKTFIIGRDTFFLLFIQCDWVAITAGGNSLQIYTLC